MVGTILVKKEQKEQYSSGDLIKGGIKKNIFEEIISNKQ